MPANTTQWELTANSVPPSSTTDPGLWPLPPVLTSVEVRCSDVITGRQYSYLMCLIWVAACNCNGRSNRCFFDEDLYRRTGHGGHCIECQGGTTGVNCERCHDNFFRFRDQDICQPCNCDTEGSLTAECDSNGQCRCKPGVTGAKCDRCDANFYDFGPFGCR